MVAKSCTSWQLLKRYNKTSYEKNMGWEWDHERLHDLHAIFGYITGRTGESHVRCLRSAGDDPEPEGGREQTGGDVFSWKDQWILWFQNENWRIIVFTNRKTKWTLQFQHVICSIDLDLEDFVGGIWRTRWPDRWSVFDRLFSRSYRGKTMENHCHFDLSSGRFESYQMTWGWFTALGWSEIQVDGLIEAAQCFGPPNLAA